METFTRRSFLKSVAVGGASAATLGVLGGCSPAAHAETAQAESVRAYEGRAQGMRGHIGVHVTLDGNSIVAVDVVENTETPLPVSEAAIAVIPQAIVDAQTVNVDMVTGATLSSMAIINATSEALKAADVDNQFKGAAPAVQLKPVEETECDILIVGGGCAGCNAAIAARYSQYGKELNDLSVILVEKQGFIGGSTQLSGGTFGAMVPLNNPTNVDKYISDLFPADAEYPVDPAFARNMVVTSGFNALQNQQMGFSFVSIDGMGDPSEYDSLLGFFDEPRPNPTVFGEGVWSFAGWKIMQYMKDRIAVAGVDTRINTQAKKLVVENGTVMGALMETPAGQYTITAKKVILASGGFTRNPDMLAKYAPSYTNAIIYSNAGCTGDGITMTESLGSVVDGNNELGGPLGVEALYGAFNDMGYDFGLGMNFPIGYSCVIVNKAGKRFMTDCASMVADEGPLPRKVMEEVDGMAYSVFDSANPAAEVAEASSMQNSIFKADSIAELARIINVPEEALVATIDHMNELQSSGLDDEEFGVANADMLPIAQAPYYAVVCRGTVCFDTAVGLRVGENCELVTSEGVAIPNLYCVGELSYLSEAMSGLAGSMATGRIAGDHARQALA